MKSSNFIGQTKHKQSVSKGEFFFYAKFQEVINSHRFKYFLFNQEKCMQLYTGHELILSSITVELRNHRVLLIKLIYLRVI